jgi:hypothetical protein
MSACIHMTPTGWIFMKFNIGDFHKICLENPNVVKIGGKCWAL